MAETRARDLAKSLGQAVRTNNIASDGSLTGGIEVYDSSGLLPTSYDSANSGQQAFTKDSDRLFIHTGQGWFNIAIVNTTPIFTTSPLGSYTLASDATAYKNGTATTITIQARDSEGFPVTYAATGNTAFNNMAHVDKDSAAGFIFTVEPKSQDSAGSAVMPNGTLTFTATDGVNIASAVSTFALTFDTTVANSEGTTYLLKAIGNVATPNDDFDDVSDTNNTLTSSGTPYMGTFSPYNSAGYSLYVNASGDWIRNAASGNAPNLGTGNFTVECWAYRTGHPSNSHHDIIMSCREGAGAPPNGEYWDLYFAPPSGTSMHATDNKVGWQWNQPSGNSFTAGAVTNNTWYHLAACKVGSTVTLYLNGVAVGTSTSMGNIDTDGKITIGGFSDGSYRFNGYICDARVVAGTAVYTANFTPPSAPLTAVSGTTFLLGAKAMMIDGSSNQHAMQSNGTPEMIAYTPYKHELYTASTHGGSVFMDGDGDKITSTGSELLSIGSTSAAFTIEAWIYISTHVSGTAAIFSRASGNTSNVFAIDFDGSGHIKLMLGGGYTGSDVKAQYNSVLKLKTWHHVALVRASATNTKLYVDGIVATENGGDTVYSTDWTVAAGTTAYIGTAHYDGGGASTRTLNGFMSDLRIVKGAAVYTGNFTPPSKPLTKTGGTYPSSTNVSNPTASQTKLLMNFTEGKLIDHSGTFNLLPSAEAESDTGVQVFSEPSFYGPSSGTRYLDSRASEAMNFNTQDYTLESWIYTSANSYDFMDLRVAGGSANQNLPSVGFYTAFNGPELYFAGSKRITGPSHGGNNQWYHVAIQRYFGKIFMYVNGVQDSELYADTNDYGAQRVKLGGAGNTASSGTLAGNMSNFRATRGKARYPFDPLKEIVTNTKVPSGMTAVGNSGNDTQIIACHHATATTQGGNHSATVSIHGNAVASDVAPFAGGRSVYFPDDNSYMTVSAGDYKDFGTGDFTIECWFKQTSDVGGVMGIWGGGAGTFNDIFNAFTIHSPGVGGGNRAGYVIGSGGTNVYTNGANFSNTGQIVIDKYLWYHVACSKVSNVYYWFLNGSLLGELSNSGSVNYQSSQAMPIAAIDTGTANSRFHGYISNFRLIKGTGIYRKDFAVPTSAFTG